MHTEPDAIAHPPSILFCVVASYHPPKDSDQAIVVVDTLATNIVKVAPFPCAEVVPDNVVN